MIRRFDDQELEAEIVGTDPMSDIAVLRVDSNDLPAITIGDSDALRVGELVLAIGSPLAEQFAHTVSMGVVSAKDRADLRLSQYENYIQTDAAINPGNSGGALINMEGHLVGINTAIASRSGGYQGIGFAIPINMARSVMESIIEEGRVVRSYMGIQQGAMVDRVMARALDLDVTYGVVVGGVVADSPADEAGLAEGDVLLRKDGEPIRDWSQFRLSVANAEPGSEVEFEIHRDGERRTVTVTLEEMPEDETIAAVPDEEVEDLREELGFSVADLTDNIRRQLNLQSGVEGVVVTGVQRGSRAQRQGLRERDVIFQIQNQPVTNEEEFYSVVSSLISAEQEAILMRVNRGGNSIYIAMEL
ncbi:MAG: trypsin-like peptidase domain-containing protein [Balneolaceae bacterium]